MYVYLKFCLNRMGGSKKKKWKQSIEWNFQSCIYNEAMTSAVIAPSPWKLFSCYNGKSFSSYSYHFFQ